MDNILVHTYGTKWLQNLNTTFIADTNNIQNRIIQLENIEKGFYAKFGANTYEQFMNKIRQLFEKYPQDRQVFYNFRNDQLRKSLLRVQGTKTSVYDLPVHFQIKLNNPDAVRKAINKNLKEGLREIGKVNGDIYEATISLDRENLRRVANEAFGSKAKRGKLTYDTIKRDFYQQIDNNPERFLKIDVEGTGLTLEEFKQQFERQARSFPWGYTLQELKLLEQDPDSNSRLRMNLEQARNVIKNYVINTLGAGASQELQESLSEVWEQKIGSNFTNLSFFSAGAGGTFINSIIGALGEFQYAVLITYLNKRCKNLGISPEIVGNIQNPDQFFGPKGEQGKTDVLLQTRGQRWGAQIKNYNLNNTNSQIKTNIHPYYFSILTNMNQNERDDFLTFVANVFFDADYGSLKSGELEYLTNDFLAKEIAAVLSLQTSYQITDTVAFYFIGGTYLIPGSKILRAIELSKTKILGKILITSSHKPISEHEFHHTTYEDPDTKRKRKPYLYEKYWTRDTNAENGWVPTTENKDLAKNLITSSISIKTAFNYKEILDDSMRIFIRR